MGAGGSLSSLLSIQQHCGGDGAVCRVAWVYTYSLLAIDRRVAAAGVKRHHRWAEELWVEGDSGMQADDLTDAERVVQT